MTRRAVIESWTDRVVSGGLLESFVDLHVDEIDSSWARRDRWLDAALAALQIAAEVRDAKRLRVTVAVGLSLLASSDRQGLPVPTFRDVQRELDMSPPSLYLFPQGKEPWLEDEDFSPWRGAVYLEERAAQAHFREWRDDEDDEYRRVLFLSM